MHQAKLQSIEPQGLLAVLAQSIVQKNDVAKIRIEHLHLHRVASIHTTNAAIAKVAVLVGQFSFVGIEKEFGTAVNVKLTKVISSHAVKRTSDMVFQLQPLAKAA